MTDHGNAQEHSIAGAEPSAAPDVAQDRTDALPATVERAPPAAPATDQTRQGRGAEVGPVRIDRVVLGVDPAASEPFVLPPEGLVAFVLGNKRVWRRFVASVVLVPIAILVLAVALRIAGIHLNGALTLTVTGAATALGMTARAYLAHRRAIEQAPAPASDPAPGSAASSS